jgi:preprotein translocase subunit SecB
MEYSEFLAKIEPVNLGLDSAQCSLDRPNYWKRPKAETRRVLSSKYTVVQLEKDFFDIDAEFSLSVQWPAESGRITEALKIECVFTGHFHTSREEVPADLVERFAETEAWLVFWPFFRQFVSDTTARMAIQPILIPLAVSPGKRTIRMQVNTDVAKGKAPKHVPVRTKRVKS